MGVHPNSTEILALMTKMLWIMTTPDPGVTVDEVVAVLPSVEDCVRHANAGFEHSFAHIGYDWYLNLFVALAHGCEKLGLHDQALKYAEEAATNIDITEAGTIVPGTHCQGFRVKGRCLAAMGKPKEAEESFESALDRVAGCGFHLLETLALRDLKVFVLDKDGRSESGSMRLKASILQLLGASPTSEQVEALALALGPVVDLSAVLLCDSGCSR